MSHVEISSCAGLGWQYSTRRPCVHHFRPVKSETKHGSAREDYMVGAARAHTRHGRLPWRGGKAEVVPAPCRLDSERLERLQAGDVRSKGKVSIAYLQGRNIRAGISPWIERSNYMSSIDPRIGTDLGDQVCEHDCHGRRLKPHAGQA